MPHQSQQSWLTLAEAATQYPLSLQTLRRWAKDGRVNAELREGPSGQMYYIEKASIDEIAAGLEPRTLLGRSRLGELEEQVTALAERVRALELDRATVEGVLRLSERVRHLEDLRGP